MNHRLEQRVRRYRSRVATRAWAYRQRHHAHGVWLRVRRLLAASARVFAIEPATAERLLAAGARLADVGQHLEPPRPIVILGAQHLPLIVGARELRVALSAELLAAPALALLPFAADGPRT